jgi:hypothetical protein
VVFGVLNRGDALGFLGTVGRCSLREVNERDISRGYDRDDVTKIRLGHSGTDNICKTWTGSQLCRARPATHHLCIPMEVFYCILKALLEA